jgi:acetylornithine deacetylase/succinyl-diaminopimelate desuccinylase-like protein
MEERVQIKVRSLMVVPPVIFAPDCIEAVSKSALAIGVAFEPMVSGAMHDASRMAAVAPTGMIFVPSHQGISHHGDEWTDPQQLGLGCQVLADTLLALAKDAG